ncbi:hypothetical protein H0H92_010259 [Tricholoma furcatifolium]|nr:hypothetical protein H0H92_010259 [Tricholoma furcatifolium]
MRLWMPACMVRLVEPRLVEKFENVLETKRVKKAGKGRGKTKAKATVSDEDDTALDESPKPKTTKARKKKRSFINVVGCYQRTVQAQALQLPHNQIELQNA